MYIADGKKDNSCTFSKSPLKNSSALPAQLWVLQLVLWLESPGHLLPPPKGAGLIHERERDWVPPPQALLQDDHPPQPPQLPCPAKSMQMLMVTIYPN